MKNKVRRQSEILKNELLFVARKHLIFFYNVEYCFVLLNLVNLLVTIFLFISALTNITILLKCLILIQPFLIVNLILLIAIHFDCRTLFVGQPFS